MANTQDLRELERDPRLFLYTSLTAGSSHIITATSRLETILKANKIPFQAIDIATDEQHRKLWQRRAGQRKLPGLVKEGFVLGDLEEVEEWNEYGELKENIGPVPTTGAAIAPAKPPGASTTAASTSSPPTKPEVDTSKRIALPGAAEMKARIDAKATSGIGNAPSLEKMTSAPAEKERSIQTSIRFKGDVEKQGEHLSAPPSANLSTPVTPELASSAEQTPGSKAAAGAEDASVGKSTSKMDKEDSKHTRIDDGRDAVDVGGKSSNIQASLSKAEEPSATSASATAIPTVLEQMKDTVTKAVSSVTEAGAFKKAETNGTSATGEDVSSTKTSPPSDSPMDQVKDSANKVMSTATKAVQPASNAESTSATASEPVSNAKVKTIPNPIAASEAVESGEMDEAQDASPAPSNAKDVTTSKSGEDETTGARSALPSDKSDIVKSTPTQTAAQITPTNKAVEGTDDIKPQAQAAADPREATKSVED